MQNGAIPATPATPETPIKPFRKKWLITALVGIVIILAAAAFVFYSEIASSSVYAQIKDSKVITDPALVKAAIESDQHTIAVVENPSAIPNSVKPQNNSFQAYFVSLYESFHANTANDAFSQYVALPYYFISPNYLVVHDKERFMTDLGYDVMRNILVSKYHDFVMKEPPKFLVLSKPEYVAEYIKAQVKRFKGEIVAIQSFIDENKAVIKKNDAILAEARATLADSDPKQLADLEQQVNSVRQTALAENAQAEQSVAPVNKIITDFSDPNSKAYREAEITVGAFIPPSEIIMQRPVHSEENLAMDDLQQMVRLLVHESLHYYADNSGKKQELDSFLFEGLTEYLALKAIGYSDETMVYVSGYPVHIQIVALLAEKIPLSDLEQIHFYQDRALLEQDFKKYFPDSSYSAFSDLGKQIDLWWFTEGFGQPNTSYVNDDNVTKAKDILKLTS